MKHFLLVLALILIPATSFAVNGSGNISNVVGFGGSSVLSNTSQPTVFGGDITKYYSASCSFGASNVTGGNFYKCYKNGYSGTGSGPGTDWQVGSTKTAYCPGFYLMTNQPGGTAGVGFSFGYGTAAVTNNSASTPTGNVAYAPTGGNFGQVTAMPGGQSAAYGQVVWVPIPFSFSGLNAGAAIFPYVRADTGSSTLNINFLCTDL